MKLFPYSMIRVSGGPFDHLEALTPIQSPKIVAEIHSLKNQLDSLKEQISDKLYNIIPTIPHHHHQKRLINLRRDIFNRRRISTEKLSAPEMSAAMDHLDNRLREDIETYRQILSRMDQLMMEGEQVFNNDVAQSRDKLRELSLNENLQKGLLLSSQSLYKRIPGYTQKKTGMKKKDFQTERGLTKYISRMYAKTSPFSTFTSLVMAKLMPPPLPVPDSDNKPLKPNNRPFIRLNHDDGLKPEPEPEPATIHHIRLNNFLYEYLVTLLTKNRNIYPYFLIRPNPTLKQHPASGQVADHYVYLTNSKNVEAFQRIPANPALEVFVNLASEKKEGMVYRQMVQTIMDEEYIDAPAEPLEDYIDQLIQYGFLEFNIGVSGIDPDWDKALSTKLAPLSHLPLIAELCTVLKSLRQWAEQYATAGCSQRTAILEEAFGQFKDICMKLHEDAGLPEVERLSPEEQSKKPEANHSQKHEPGKNQTNGASANPEEELVFKQIGNTRFGFKPSNILYEDTSLDTAPVLDKEEMESFIHCLYGWLKQMKRFEGLFEEQQRMLHYFTGKYGESASIDMLTFYEDYFRDIKKPQSIHQEITPVPAIQLRRAENNQWLKCLENRLLKKKIEADPYQIPHQIPHQINITDDDLQAANNQCPHSPTGSVDMDALKRETDCSYGGFFQFFIDSSENGKNGTETLKGVVNSIFPGYGKMFSRFLHIFDDEVTQCMRQWNASSMTGQRIFLEDSDASYFNANLHPPLMPYEILMPGSHNSLPPEQQIPIEELQVTPTEDATGKCLKLVHTPTGKRAHVFDLGFQGHKGRSQLFQLLDKFTMARYLFGMPVIAMINNLATSSSQASTAEGETEKTTKTKPAVIIHPRIVYEDRVILQRKTWYIAKELLPLREPTETDFAWFCRVDDWRRQTGLPEEVFVFAVDRMTMQHLPPDQRKHIGPDDYKPQYISFKNPLLLNLLEKSMNRVPERLKVVEMLPGSQQLLKIGPNRHVTELVVQWYTKRSATESTEDTEINGQLRDNG